MSGLGLEVERFLAEHVASVNELELVLLLAEVAPAGLTPDEAAQRLYQAPGWVAGHCEALVAMGLAAAADDGFAYAPRDAATDRAVRATGEAFRTRRTRVISAIYRRPRSSAEDFADAFRLRDDDEGRR